MKDFPAKRHPQTCPDGRLYRPAVGNSAPTESLQDQAEPTHSVVSGKVTAVEFVDLIKRELRLRLYNPTPSKVARARCSGFCNGSLVRLTVPLAKMSASNVLLPDCLVPLLRSAQQLCCRVTEQSQQAGDGYVFPAEGQR